jgi:hypothetical protein
MSTVMTTAMTTATNKCKKKVRPDLLPYGTPVFMTHKDMEFATTWASKACHSTGRLMGLDGVPMALSNWALARIKTITPTRTSVNGVDECYVKRDGKRVYISTLRSEATAPPATAAATVTVAGECINLVVEELPRSRVSEMETVLFNKLQSENVALRAENKALKDREQAAIKVLIGIST